MGGGNTSTSTQTQGPPAMLQPYLNYGLQQATQLYQSPSPSYYPGSQVANPSMATQAGEQAAIARGLHGSQVGNAADAYGTGVLGGKYLGDNPYQSAVDQSITAATMPTVNAQFSLGGRYGSGAHQGTAETALANAIAPQHYANYQQERANQQNMAGMAPQLGAQDWTDIQGLMGAGGQQDQLAQNQVNANMAHWNYNQNLAGNKLQQYLQSMGSMPFGTSGSSTSTPAGGDTGSQILKFAAPALLALLSDGTLKENIAPLEDALAKVEALQGVSFDWIGNAGGHREIGFVAQDVREIVPEVVGDIRINEAGDTKLGIDYPKLTALLVEALKTLSAKVAALEAR